MVKHAHTVIVILTHTHIYTHPVTHMHTHTHSHLLFHFPKRVIFYLTLNHNALFSVGFYSIILLGHTSFMAGP